jgi:nucleoside-diphosphate-sugar epimerase
LRILIIGGRGFIGPHVVSRLCEMGHEVALFNRCKTNSGKFDKLVQIKGEIDQLHNYIDEFKLFSPDLVLHMIAMNENSGKRVMEVFEGIARRIVVLSSMDVYRAYGIIKKLESSNLITVPMNENAPKRTKYYPHGGETEKILVENAVMNNPNLPGTILRLPMVYGPGDPYRLFNYLKRMIDDRPYILVDSERAKWRGTRGYVENVAEAIVAALTNDTAINRIYNVGEEVALSEEELIQQIANVYGWNGEIKFVKRDYIPRDLINDLPQHITADNNYKQDWIIDTSLIRKELDYKEIIPFNKSIKRTVLWNKDNHPTEQHKEFNPNEFYYQFEDQLYDKLFS